MSDSFSLQKAAIRFLGLGESIGVTKCYAPPFVRLRATIFVNVSESLGDGGGMSSIFFKHY